MSLLPHFFVNNRGLRDGIANMELDRRLLQEAETGHAGAEVYRWNGLWVSLGRFQTPERDLIDACTTPHVLRPTGGKAVMHGHDLTVAIALPLSPHDSRSVRTVYRRLVQPLVAALNRCGLPAILAEERLSLGNRAATTADCFAVTSPNDIVHRETGKKVCGCALRITERAVLLQASAPDRLPLTEPASIIRGALAQPVSEPYIALEDAEVASALDLVFSQLACPAS